VPNLPHFHRGESDEPSSLLFAECHRTGLSFEGTKISRLDIEYRHGTARLTEYQSNQGAPVYSQIENFYSAQVTHDFRFSAGKATPAPQLASTPASNYLHLGPSTAPQLSLVDLPNMT
jgi:hypothetical protein